jgi:hypothetical protein
MILNVLGSILVCIAGVVLVMWIARAILVDPHLRNQRAIISILAKLSLQQGVSKDDIDNILNEFKDK